MSGPTLLRLTAQPQALDQRLVSFGFCSPNVLEEPPTPAHEYEQPSSGVMVLAVQLEVLGETVDALREQRDLHVRGTGVRRVRSKGLRGLLLERARDQRGPRECPIDLVPPTPRTPIISHRPFIQISRLRTVSIASAERRAQPSGPKFFARVESREPLPDARHPASPPGPESDRGVPPLQTNPERTPPARNGLKFPGAGCAAA